MPEATSSSTPGNGSERGDATTKPPKKSPKHKEPDMQNEEKKTDEHH